MTEQRPTEALLPLMQAAFAAGGVLRLWPSGRSMLPLLREGVDSVLLAPPCDLALRDVVLLREEGGRFLLHRIVALDAESVTLSGDALLTTEGPFPRAAILARVECIYRGERAHAPEEPAMRLLYRRALIKKRLRRLWHRVTRR